jgi:DNA-binding transcriptional regulator YiaG
VEDSAARPDKKRKRATWNAVGVKALRKHLGFSQQELAEELGTRQQTISEWETGVYQPRGMSERLLGIIADRSSFFYGAPPDDGDAVDGAKSDG